jgi:hypothetical protein
MRVPSPLGAGFHMKNRMRIYKFTLKPGVEAARLDRPRASASGCARNAGLQACDSNRIP